MIFAVVVITKRERGACAPNVASILSGEFGELFISAKSGIAQGARQRRKFALHAFIIGRGSGQVRRGSVRDATETTWRGLGLVGFFLLVLGLAYRIRTGEQQRQHGRSSRAPLPRGKASVGAPAWRRDSRRGRGHHPLREFPPTSDKSNPLGGP